MHCFKLLLTVCSPGNLAGVVIGCIIVLVVLMVVVVCCVKGCKRSKPGGVLHRSTMCIHSQLAYKYRCCLLAYTLTVGTSQIHYGAKHHSYIVESIPIDSGSSLFYSLY